MQQVVLKPEQMGAGWGGGLISGGAQVHGQITLDICGGGYRSEALRDARRQILLTPPSAGTQSGQDIGNEVVTYRAGAAIQARDELLHHIATCPAGPVQMPEASRLKLTFKISRLHADPRWLPGTIALHLVATSTSGRSSDTVAIYQFDGKVLSAVYGFASHGTATSNELRAAALAASALRSAATPTAA